MSEAVLLYDSGCGFCRWSIEKMASWHLVADDGRVHSGGAVAAPLLRLLPGGGALAAMARAFPGAADRVYHLVATRRDRIGGVVGARCQLDPVAPRCRGKELRREDRDGLA